MKSLTPSRPQRRFLAGAVAAVMVLAAGLGYRVAGRGALDATLTRVSGSDEALAGFTLYGQTRHNTANAVTTFTLQNGVFTSETDLDAQILTAEEPYSVRGGTRWAVAPAAREEVNAAAEAVRDGSDTLSLQSEASRFRLMLSLDVPGRGTAQLPVEEVETPSPVAVRTKLQAEGALYDWLVADDPQLLDTSARNLLTALHRQSWTFTPDAAYFAMPVDTLTAPAGLCKIEAIPDDLWAARQNEQAIEYGGKTYAAGDAAEKIGSVSTLYTPADAASCVATFAAGESLGLVYVTTDNIVKADLVDAAGSCTASVELLTLAEGQHVENCFRYPQQRASDVAFELSYCTEAERQNAQYKNLLCLLRVEDGAPTALIRRPQEDDSDGYLRYIDLSDDGTRLLTVRTNTSELRYTRRGYTQTMIIIGPYGVAVAPAEGGEPLYTGLLDAGQDTGQIDQLAEHSGDVMLYTPAIELEPKAQVVIPDLAASEPDSTQTPKEETP